jgi:3-hydroxybutyryl-CoA dehydrogenase
VDIASIKKIGVIGAGQMGNGISQVAASQNFEVVMFDIASESLDKGLGTISGSCDRKITQSN